MALLNQEPISSAELGELFSALAKDYSRATGGRTLMVYEIRTGSILATLADAAAVIGPMIKDMVTVSDAVAAMDKFGHRLFNALGRAKSGDGGVFGGGRKREGQASAEALLKIAVVSSAEVTIKQTGPHGYSTEITVTPQEAVRIRERAASKRYMLQGPETKKLLTSANYDQLSAENLAKSVLSLAGSSGELNPDARKAITVMVAALRDAGFEQAIAALVLSLERRGHPDVAALVRKYQAGGGLPAGDH